MSQPRIPSPPQPRCGVIVTFKQLCIKDKLKNTNPMYGTHLSALIYFPIVDEEPHRMADVLFDQREQIILGLQDGIGRTNDVICIS